MVDDDRNSRELMRVMLAKEGYDVVTAVDGEEGLQLARSLHQSAVTLDVEMPKIDGWDILKEIKTDVETSGIPVIMATMIEEPDRVFALGASEYVTKPIDRDRMKLLLCKYHCGDHAPKVLVVEDDIRVRDILRRIFSANGWEVIEAGNGSSGIERLDGDRSDLIMLDLLMPEMDGFQVLEALRGRLEYGKVAVVVLTAADLTPEDRRRLNGGESQIVTKTLLARRDLMDTIREIITENARLASQTNVGS